MNTSKLLLISALALAATSCAGSGQTGAKSDANDSTKIAAEPYETEINIRYVVMDSISKNYKLAQNIAAKVQSMATELQTYQMQLQNQLQNMQNQIQQKAQSNGYLSQASYEADMKALEQKAASFQKLYAQRDQNAAITMDNLQKELRDSIENYINLYNKEKKYDAILFKDAGLYFNPALDITDEIVNGLNNRFTGTVEPGAAAAAATPAATQAASTPAVGLQDPTKIGK